MRTSRILLLSALLTLGIAGCNNQKTPFQKEQANKEWNGARASVLASLANEQFQSGNFDKCPPRRWMTPSSSLPKASRCTSSRPSWPSKPASSNWPSRS